jgi:drug/metabolite transporter (DMT)-like permease
VAAAWGATFPLAKQVLEVLPPFQYLAARFGVASCVLVPLAWRDLCRTPREVWARAAGVGLALGGGYALQAAGLQKASATNAAFLTGLFVVLVPVLGILRGRRPGAWEWAGVLAGTAGLVLLTGGPSPPGRPELLLLGCAAAFALHILLLDAVAPQLSPVALGALQTVVAAASMAALAAAEPTPPEVPGEVWAAVAGMGVVATAAAFVVQSWAQRFTSPVHVGLVFTAEPVFAAVLARWWLGEVLGGGQWLGAALILSGIVLAQVQARAAAREEGVREP